MDTLALISNFLNLFAEYHRNRRNVYTAFCRKTLTMRRFMPYT